jgi:hypothetical protein
MEIEPLQGRRSSASPSSASHTTNRVRAGRMVGEPKSLSVLKADERRKVAVEIGQRHGERGWFPDSVGEIPDDDHSTVRDGHDGGTGEKGRSPSERTSELEDVRRVVEDLVAQGLVGLGGKYNLDEGRQGGVGWSSL